MDGVVVDMTKGHNVLSSLRLSAEGLSVVRLPVLRVGLWCALLLSGLMLAGCGEATAPTQGDAGAISAPTTDPANEGLVARVNGEGITREQFDAHLARYQRGGTFTDVNALAAQVLDALIEQELINQAAASLDITITDAEVDAEIQALRQNIDDEAWQNFLDLNHLTEAEFFSAQRESLLTQRLRDHLLRDLDGEVPQVRARHILVATEAEANAVLTRLENGEPFVSVAQAVSLDITTSQNGGDLGWFTADELMDLRLAEVAFSLEPNQVAGPVPTRIGYHIIQTLEKSERTVEAERMPMLMENAFINWLDEQFRTAQIERYP